jgi:protein TonB
MANTFRLEEASGQFTMAGDQIKKNCLSWWIVLSLGLHIALLAWCPSPTFTIPPFPVYLVVDLFSGPAPSGTGSGLPSSRMENTKPGSNSGTRTRAQAPPQTKPEQPPQPTEPVSRKKSQLKKQNASPKPVTEPPPAETVAEDYPVSSVEAPPLETKGAETELSPIRPDALMDSGPGRSSAGSQINGIAGGQPGAGTGTGGGLGSGAGPASGSPVATPLAYGTNPPPPYPATARRRGWEGKVLLRVEVSASGSVRDVVIEKSSGYSCLDEAAQQAVYRWRFKPALQNGRPVPGQVKVPIHFNLKDAD